MEINVAAIALLWYVVSKSTLYRKVICIIVDLCPRNSGAR